MTTTIRYVIAEDPGKAERQAFSVSYSSDNREELASRLERLRVQNESWRGYRLYCLVIHASEVS